MARRRASRRSPNADRFAERPPRLVLRFAVLSALCLGAGAAAILLFTRHLNIVQAEQSAARHAEYTADAVLSDELRPADFRRPVSGERLRTLDRLLRRKLLLHGTVLVTFTRSDRVVTYATDHTLIGRRLERATRVKEALRGTLTSEATEIARPTGEGRLDVLRTYVPLRVGGTTAVVAIYQDYGPIAQTARAAFVPIAGILELVLVLLYVLLVPFLARVSRRLTRHVEKIRHQALHDDLTELPNRLQFLERVAGAVEAAERRGSAVAVLLLDLDRFKEINDTLGHQSGDTVLKAVTARLRELVTPERLVARLGGDEFAVVVEEATVQSGLDLADRIHGLLEAPFVVRGIPLSVEASIGVTLAPEHGSDVDGLMQNADVAMYAAKNEPRGVVLYDPALERTSAAQLALISELRAALETEEILIHYQPKLCLRTGEVLGVEALVRWQHPERGLLLPGEFVPLAERTGVSVALSRYVLTGVVRQLREWNERGIDLDASVNLTMFDLLDAHLPEAVASLLEREGVEPAQLQLEITESVIMSDPERVRHVINELTSVGVRLSIDDFGTGYSSLSYLKDLPVDELKIDRSFVIAMEQSESDRGIVRATIDLGHTFGLAVVAEGVETESALEQVTLDGCDFAQGFHIARPCPAEDVERFVREHVPAKRAASANGGKPRLKVARAS